MLQWRHLCLLCPFRLDSFSWSIFFLRASARNNDDKYRTKNVEAILFYLPVVFFLWLPNFRRVPWWGSRQVPDRAPIWASSGNRVPCSWKGLKNVMGQVRRDFIKSSKTISNRWRWKKQVQTVESYNPFGRRFMEWLDLRRWRETKGVFWFN